MIPNSGSLQDRFFSTRDLRETLRDLGLGVDNADFARLWKQGIVTPPTINEVEYIAWDYRSAKQLVIDYYNLKGRAEEYDTYRVDEVFIEKKELKRYKKEMVDQYLNRGKFHPY